MKQLLKQFAETIKKRLQSNYSSAGKASRQATQPIIPAQHTEEHIYLALQAAENQQKLLSLVEHSSDYMAIADLDGKNIYVNKAGRQLVGLEEEQDLSELGSLDFYSPEHVHIVRDTIWPALMEKGKWSGTVYLRHFITGENIPGYINAMLIKDPLTGKAIGRGVALRDLRPELAAQEEQKKLITLVDNSVDLMSLLGMDGKNTYINEAGRALLGLDKQEDCSRVPITDFHTPEQLAFVNTEIIPNVMTKGRWAGRFAIRQITTGEIIPLENNCMRIDDPVTGTPIAVGAVMRDLRPELAAQQALRESEARFRLLANFMPQLIWTSDAMGSLNYYNDAVFSYCGLKHHQLQNDGWLSIVLPEDREGNIREWERSVTSGNDFHFEHRFRRYDGEYRWHLSRAVAQKDENGEIRLWIGTSTDINDQKKMTEQLERQVTLRTVELQKANQELLKINRELEQYAYIASHDLQEPLRKIRVYSDMLYAEAVKKQDQAAANHLQKVLASSERMSLLISDLLEFSRLQHEEKIRDKVDLNEIMQNVANDFELMIREKKASVSIGVLPAIEASAVQMNQLLYNLLNNSLKFSKDQVPPVITIEAVQINGGAAALAGLDQRLTYYDISITDNGIGFNNNNAKQIFSLFKRLHTKEAYTGTGIGLALCHKIISLHHGTITASGEEGKGSIFHIILPVQQPK